jgi:hypothetical protein
MVGIELNVDGPTAAAVYAFDRSVDSVARLEQIVELGLSRGEIPVVRFDIPEAARQREKDAATASHSSALHVAFQIFDKTGTN